MSSIPKNNWREDRQRNHSSHVEPGRFQNVSGVSVNQRMKEKPNIKEKHDELG